MYSAFGNNQQAVKSGQFSCKQFITVINIRNFFSYKFYSLLSFLDDGQWWCRYFVSYWSWMFRKFIRWKQNDTTELGKSNLMSNMNQRSLLNIRLPQTEY